MMAENGHIQAFGHLIQRRYRRQGLRGPNASCLFVIIFLSILEILKSFIFMTKIEFYQKPSGRSNRKTVDFFFCSFFYRGVWQIWRTLRDESPVSVY